MYITENVQTVFCLGGKKIGHFLRRKFIRPKMFVIKVYCPWICTRKHFDWLLTYGHSVCLDLLLEKSCEIDGEKALHSTEMFSGVDVFPLNCIELNTHCSLSVVPRPSANIQNA